MIQAAAQAIVNHGKTYASVVSDGGEDYLVTIGGTGGGIADAAKSARVSTAGAPPPKDILGGPVSGA